MTTTLNDMTAKNSPRRLLKSSRRGSWFAYAEAEGLSLTGPDGLRKQFTKNVLEAALNEEMTEHLGHQRNRAPRDRESGNVRDGTRPKMVLTHATGEVELDVPMGRLFARVYAPSTLGSFLRAFTFGHVRQLDAVAARSCSRWQHAPGSSFARLIITPIIDIMSSTPHQSDRRGPPSPVVLPRDRGNALPQHRQPLRQHLPQRSRVRSRSRGLAVAAGHCCILGSCVGSAYMRGQP